MQIRSASKVHIPTGRLVRRFLALGGKHLEILQIHSALDRSLQRRHSAAGAQRTPIEGGRRKPRVRLDLLNALLLVANAIGRYLTAQVPDQALRGARNARRHPDRIDAAQNGIIRAHVVLAAERWLADEQLVHEHAERPVVDGPIVALVEDDLRRNVFGCARERPRFVARLNDLCESKVDLF